MSNAPRLLGPLPVILKILMATSIHGYLRNREQVGRLKTIAPQKRFFCLDEFIPIDHPAVNAVILGFMQDGEHFISYSDSGESESFELLVWRFSMNKPLTCVAAIPLFQCCSGCDFGSSEVADLPPSIRFRVIEINDTPIRPSAVLVHASSNGSFQNSTDVQRHSLTLVLGLLTGNLLCVLNTTYFVQPPYPFFEPFQSLILGITQGTHCPTATLILNTGDSIRFLSVRPAANSEESARDAFCFDDQVEAEMSNSYKCIYNVEANVEWRTPNGGPWEATDQKSHLGQNAIVLRQYSFDVEQYLSRYLEEIGREVNNARMKSRDKLYLADYDLRIIETSHQPNRPSEITGDEAECYVAVGVLAFLNREAGHGTSLPRARGAVEVNPERRATIVLVSHLLLLCGKSARVLECISTRTRSCAAAAVAAGTRSRLLEAEMRAWQAALKTPGPINGDTLGASEWDNDAVLEGRCADRLVNPIYPIVITPPRR